MRPSNSHDENENIDRGIRRSQSMPINVNRHRNQPLVNIFSEHQLNECSHILDLIDFVALSTSPPRIHGFTDAVRLLLSCVMQDNVASVWSGIKLELPLDRIIRV